MRSASIQRVPGAQEHNCRSQGDSCRKCQLPRCSRWIKEQVVLALLTQATKTLQRLAKMRTRSPELPRGEALARTKRADGLDIDIPHHTHSPKQSCEHPSHRLSCSAPPETRQRPISESQCSSNLFHGYVHGNSRCILLLRRRELVHNAIPRVLKHVLGKLSSLHHARCGMVIPLEQPPHTPHTLFRMDLLPAASSTRTVSICPLAHARCRGVSPDCAVGEGTAVHTLAHREVHARTLTQTHVAHTSTQTCRCTHVHTHLLTAVPALMSGLCVRRYCRGA